MDGRDVLPCSAEICHTRRITDGWPAMTSSSSAHTGLHRLVFQVPAVAEAVHNGAAELQDEERAMQ
uniref:Uncharacterized protein n=1 Tax=Oryza punctata TaxID=4537 RepID=A0A0E0LG06_ORYPU